MDARAVSEATGIGVGTLNVWIQRSLIPGMDIGARGRQREFDLDTATHILVMAELVKLGFGAPFASQIAQQRGRHRRLLIGEAVVEARRRLEHPGGKIILRAGEPEATATIGFDSENDLLKILEKFPGGRPAVYVV